VLWSEDIRLLVARLAVSGVFEHITGFSGQIERLLVSGVFVRREEILHFEVLVAHRCPRENFVEGCLLLKLWPWRGLQEVEALLVPIVALVLAHEVEVLLGAVVLELGALWFTGRFRI